MQLVSILKTLLAPGPKAKAPTSRQIAAALDQARADRDAAASEAERLRGTRLAALVDPKSAASHAAELAAARQRVEDSDLLIEALSARLAEAETAEQEAERRRRYDAARAKRDAVAAGFPERYHEHSKGLLDLLSETAEADAAADAANDDLPEGADPIPSVEAIRGRPGLPRRVIRVDHVDLWTSPGADQPIPDEMQARVKREREARGDGETWGSIAHVNRAVGHHSTSSYVLKRFERITYLDSIAGEVGPRLHRMTLPALRVGEPSLYEPRPYPMEATDVLAALARAATQPVAEPEQDRREKRTEYRLVRDEPPAEPQPSTTDSFRLILPEAAF